jgi:hypothetical protein
VSGPLVLGCDGEFLAPGVMVVANDPYPGSEESEACPGRSSAPAPMSEALDLDFECVERQSLRSHMAILLRTVPAVLDRQGIR